MKWYCWILIIDMVCLVILGIWYLIDDKNEKKRRHRNCEKIRRAHRHDKVEKGYFKPMAYLHLLELQMHYRKH